MCKFFQSARNLSGQALNGRSKTSAPAVLSAGSIPQCPTSSCSWGSLMPWKNSIPLPHSTLTVSSPEVTLHHFLCSEYLLRCLCLALPVCETSPRPGPCTKLCCKASVKPQTGEMSGETGGTTSTGGKSRQHSLQRVADATMLTQSLPKGLFVSSLHCLFPCTQLLTHTKPMSDCTGINTHMLKPNHNVLLLPAGKGGLECFLFSLFLTPTEKSGITNNNLYREDRAV